MSKPNHTFTPTRAGNTRGFSYHDLREYTGQVPQRRPVPTPAPAGQTASFRQGVVDASYGQPHHEMRAIVVGLVVGAVVGDRLARTRGRR